MNLWYLIKYEGCEIYMKSVLIGIGVFIVGFIISIIGSNFFDGGSAEFSYYTAIVFSVLYLSGVVGVATSLILKALEKIIRINKLVFIKLNNILQNTVLFKTEYAVFFSA